MRLREKRGFLLVAFPMAVAIAASIPSLADPTPPILPLVIEKAATARAEWLKSGRFKDGKAGAVFPDWSGGKMVQSVAADGSATACLELRKTEKSAREELIRHNQTIRMDAGCPYHLAIEYQTDCDGLYVQLNYYAFGTWGDTIKVEKHPLPPSAAMTRADIVSTPPPGTICVGLWIAVPAASAGVVRLKEFTMSGSSWGGVPYPPPPDRAQDVGARWEVIDAVENSAPVNTAYFGPNARNVFPLTRAEGAGAPWLPAGAVVPPKKGSYAIAVEVRELGGGHLLARYAGQVTAEADEYPEARLLFPDIRDSSRVDLAAWNAETGALVKQTSLTFRFQRATPLSTLPDWSDIAAVVEPWAGNGRLAIHVPGMVVRDYVKDEAIPVRVMVTRDSSPGRGEIIAVRYDRTPVASIAADIAAGEGVQEISLDIAPPGPDVYDIQAVLTRDGVRIDERSLRLGLRDNTPPPPWIAPVFPDMLLVEEMHFHSLRFAPASHRLFGEFLTDMKRNGSTVAGIGYYASDLQPMPGVYRFGELEQRVKLAIEAGMKGYIYLRFHSWPEWADWEAAIDQDGVPDEGQSTASAAVRNVVAGCVSALAEHFRGNSDVIGYGRWNLNTDWVYHDRDGRYFDYSPSSLALWREFSGGLPPPRPAATGPDMRGEWRKWAAFRSHVVRLWTRETLVDPIRSKDPARLGWSYVMVGGQGAMETLWPELLKDGIFPAHGGSEAREFQRHGDLARQNGMLYRHESVAAPERHPLETDLYLFHALFNGISLGHRPMFNVAYNIGWNTTRGLPGVRPSLDRRRVLLGLISQLYHAKYERVSGEWAQFCSWDDLLLNARHFQWYALSSNLELGYMHETINPDAVSDRTPAGNWKKYKLIFAYGPRVITGETAKTIGDYVRDGGVFAVVLRPGTGMNEFAASLLGLDVTNAVTMPGGLVGAGCQPWFKDGRKLVIKENLDVTPPANAVVCASAAKNAIPLAWSLPLGKGTILAFNGLPDLAASAGFLEDMLGHVGIERRFTLKSAVENDIHPPEAIEFANPVGDRVFLIHRAVRWNKHNDLMSGAAAKNAAPTWDGFASVYPRVDVTLTCRADPAATYEAARWENGEWKPLGTLHGPLVTHPDLRVNVAPGETGVIRLSVVK